MGTKPADRELSQHAAGRKYGTGGMISVRLLGGALRFGTNRTPTGVPFENGASEWNRTTDLGLMSPTL